MERSICRQNIRSYRRLLEMIQDQRERETVVKLLAYEEAKLKELTEAEKSSLSRAG